MKILNQTYRMVFDRHIFAVLFIDATLCRISVFGDIFCKTAITESIDVHMASEQEFFSPWYSVHSEHFHISTFFVNYCSWSLSSGPIKEKFD